MRGILIPVKALYSAKLIAQHATAGTQSELCYCMLEQQSFFLLTQFDWHLARQLEQVFPLPPSDEHAL